MSHIIEIETAPFVQTQRMLNALSAEGISGALIDDQPRLRLLVSSPEIRQVASRVLAALETIVRLDPAPLVPEQIDESTFAIRPPAG
jgi:hypothetical protein